MGTGLAHNALDRADGGHGPTRCDYANVSERSHLLLLRTGVIRYRSARAWAFAALVVLGHPSILIAQETRTLPLLQSIPPHSIVDVHTLPPPSLSTSPGEIPTELTPLLVPDPEGLRKWKGFIEDVPRGLPEGPGFVEDTASIAEPPLSQTLTVMRQFEGLANSDNVAILSSLVLPPDPNLGVGPAHVFQMANFVGRITDKTGANATSFSLRSFFNLDTGFGETDPRVIYDAVGARWFGVYLQHSKSVGSSSLIVAVSRTSDPTGAFCLYRLGNPTAETFQHDFPILGVSDDKVVVSYMGFAFSPNTFVGSGYYALSKARLMACEAAGLVRFAPDPSRSVQYPVQSLTSTSDLYLVLHRAVNQLALFTVKGTPEASPVTETSTFLAIHDWSAPPDAPQPGSGVLLRTTLGTGDARVLSAAWQNHSLWLSGNEACIPAGDSAARSCLRLIELRTDSSSVRQDMTFGAQSEYYYYPAVRPDSAGNVHIVFARSSASAFASVRITGRRLNDPLNSLQTSTDLRAGAGAQTNPSGRMGDYFGAAVDPSDPLAVWVIGEYIRSTADADWGTSVAQITFTSAPPLETSAFVTRLYQQVLGREPDPAGLQGFIDQIQQFGSVVPTVLAFFHSTEFLSRNTTDEQFLTILYRTFLDRDPDPLGFNAFLAALQASTLTRDNLLDLFIDSPEFAAQASFLPPLDPITEFAAALYVRILGRGPDQSGLQSFVSQLQQTRTVLPTVQLFLTSPEFLARNTTNTEFVTLLYRVFLARVPDPEGLATWVTALNQGTVTRNQLVTQFAATPEFQAIQQQLFP